MRAADGMPMYLLAATILADRSVIRPLESIKRPKAPKLHWRELGRDEQLRVMRAVAEIPSLTTVVIGTPMNPRKQERARRKCLETLVFMLADEGAEELVLESRGADLDRLDVQLMDSLKSRGHAGGLRLEHARGRDEPRLWVADQVLGALGDSLCKSGLGDDWIRAWGLVERSLRLEFIDL